MSESESQANSVVESEVEFLLLPQDWKVEVQDVVRRIGIQLSEKREQNKLTKKNLAAELGISSTMVEGIEYSNFSTRGANLAAYRQYATSMGTNLIDLFTAAIHDNTREQETPKLTKQELIAKATTVVAGLETKNQPITGPVVAKTLNVPRSTLTSHSEIAQLINIAEAERIRKAEDQLVGRAEKLLADLYPENEYCSQESLAYELSISRSKLRHSKRIVMLLKDRGG